MIPYSNENKYPHDSLVETRIVVLSEIVYWRNNDNGFIFKGTPIDIVEKTNKIGIPGEKGCKIKVFI